jgi:hypothetical protein
MPRRFTPTSCERPREPLMDARGLTALGVRSDECNQLFIGFAVNRGLIGVDPSALLQRCKSAYAGVGPDLVPKKDCCTLPQMRLCVAGIHVPHGGACAHGLQTPPVPLTTRRCCGDPAGGVAPAEPDCSFDRSRLPHGGALRGGQHTCDTRTGSSRRACIPPKATAAPRNLESAAPSGRAQPRNHRSWKRSIRRSSVTWLACPYVDEPTRAASPAQPSAGRTADCACCYGALH